MERKQRKSSVKRKLDNEKVNKKLKVFLYFEIIYFCRLKISRKRESINFSINIRKEEFQARIKG